MLHRVRLDTHHLSDLQYDAAVERLHAQSAVLLSAQFDGWVDLLSAVFPIRWKTEKR